MRISSLKLDWNLGKSFWFDRQEPKLGHLFVRFKSDADVLTKNGFVHAKPGNFIFYHQKERMAYGSGDWEFNHDYFRFSMEDEALLLDVPTEMLFTASMPEKMEMLLGILAEAFFSGEKEREKILDMAGSLFLWQASGFAKTVKRDTSDVSRRQAIAELRRAMLNAPQNPWSIREIAGRAMLSEAYFQKLYKQMFGASCIEEMVSARIRMAENLLLSTHKKETEIAALCGYNHIEHFIRQFKKITGETPSAFKKRYMREGE